MRRGNLMSYEIATAPKGRLAMTIFLSVRRRRVRNLKDFSHSFEVTKVLHPSQRFNLEPRTLNLEHRTVVFPLNYLNLKSSP